VCGSGFLNFDVRENTIWFNTNSRSFKLGAIKVSWEEIQEIVKGSAGSTYKVELDE
jgi:hypothetical protein